MYMVSPGRKPPRRNAPAVSRGTPLPAKAQAGALTCARAVPRLRNASAVVEYLNTYYTDVEPNKQHVMLSLTKHCGSLSLLYARNK
jgi:hypothetical protein